MSCLLLALFFRVQRGSGSEAQRERQEPHSVLAGLVEWSGVDMDVYIRESLWPLEPYNDQKLRVASAKE